MSVFPSTVDQVKPGTLIQLSVVGTKNEGGGRQVHAVNHTTDLHGMLSQYSELTQAKEVDMAQLTQLAKANPTAAVAYLSQFEAKSNASKSATLTDIIVDAVANYLVKEHDMIEATSDPGVSKFYFNRGDLQPQWINGKGGIAYCMVALTAPFGLS